MIDLRNIFPLNTALWAKFLNSVQFENATDSYLVYIQIMEYVYEINIFGLKMMIKSVLEKIFFVHAQSFFSESLFHY